MALKEMVQKIGETLEDMEPKRPMLVIKRYRNVEKNSVYDIKNCGSEVLLAWR